MVIIPYNNNPVYPNTYGTPAITLSSIKNFLDAWENGDGQGNPGMGTLLECSGVAEQTETFPLTNQGNRYITLGTRVGLKTVLNSTNKHCAICIGSTLPILACDTFAIWIRPINFSSFQPAVSIIYATE
jgi:hypothetical protein